MQPSSPNHHLQSMASDGSAKKVRKPYTITKSRESWTEEEHDKFLEALQLFDRDWKKIEDFVGSKTVIQIRSHAQKYFLKVQKNGIIAHVPPPRPKRKATHPYPLQDSKNALVPLQVSTAYPSALSCLSPRYPPWDDTTTLLNTASSVHVPSQENYTALEGVEEDGVMGIARRDNRNFCIGSSTQILGNCETPEQGSQSSLCHGIPDFAEVYNFIGSIFDPSTEGHMQKLKEMTPINVETVLLLMRNLTLNLSSSDFKQFRKLVSSNDIDSKWVGGVKGVVAANPISDHLPCQTPATG